MHSKILLSLLGTFALAMSVPSKAADITGEAVEKCTGLYNYLVDEYIDSDAVKNKETWANNLASLIVVTVQLYKDGKGLVDAEKATKELKAKADSFDDERSKVNFLNSRIDYCEALQRQIEQQ